MEPGPKRRIPRAAMLAVPLVALSLVLLVVFVAWRSSRVARSRPNETPLPSVQVASETFLGCTDCHGDLDKVFKEGRLPNLLFTHAKHFAKGVSDCSVCHSANTHEPDRINKPTMPRCFMCHGIQKGSIAPGACSTCHPPSMPREPPSHFAGGWLPAKHAKAALAEQFECLTCHRQSFCNACHGLTLPHPKGWDASHPATYFRDPSVCARCHPITEPGTRDFCDRCHHPRGPTDVSWREYHPTAVKQGTAQPCFQCHAPATCSTCHRTGVLDLTADEALLRQSPAPSTGTG